MNTFKNKYTFVLFLWLIFAPVVYAQVTVGSLLEPAKAALLQIKDTEPNHNALELNNITSIKGGVLMPRIQLVDVESLEPFIVSPTARQKKLHIGLVVYNLTEIPDKFKKGMYYWDGAEWNELVLYIPR